MKGSFTTVAKIGGGLFVGILATFLLLHHHNQVVVPVTPEDAAVPTFTHCVAILDDTTPTIPVGLVLNSPQVRASLLKGFMQVGTLQELSDPKSEWSKCNYDQLVKQAGGAPALLFLNDKDVDNGIGTRFPTDPKVMEQLLKKNVIGLPPPLTEKANYTVYPNAARDTKVEADDKGGEYVVDGGEKRRLTAKSNPQKFSKLEKYGDHYPVFPKTEWYEIDRSAMFGGRDWIFDQDGHGSCVGNGWAGALMRCRVLNGMREVKLSPAFAYSLINDNQDEGAVISDGIAAMQKVGTCTFDLVGQDPIYQKQMPKDAKDEAARFKLATAYRCDTWEETISAMLTGRCLCVYGYMVGKNFEHFSKDGVAGHDKGPGNHCNFAEGVKKLPNGQWVLDDVNSWRYDWGPFKNGHVYIDEQHLFGNGDRPDVCVIRMPARDPKEPHKAPAYKPKKAA